MGEVIQFPDRATERAAAANYLNLPHEEILREHVMEDFTEMMCGECGSFNEADATGCNGCSHDFDTYTKMYDGMKVGHRAGMASWAKVAIVSALAVFWSAVTYLVLGAF